VVRDGIASPKFIHSAHDGQDGHVANDNYIYGIYVSIIYYTHIYTVTVFNCQARGAPNTENSF
jgi:hypothetical protein